jgi:hypothetical protein
MTEKFTPHRRLSGVLSASSPFAGGLTGLLLLCLWLLPLNAATTGAVAAWGSNSSSQTVVPAGLTQVMAIVAGSSHTVALKVDGKVVAWGSNGRGQTNVPMGLTGVMAIAAGDAYTVALKGDGTVVAWGSNFSGETTVPAGLGGVVAIAAGYAHTVA